MKCNNWNELKFKKQNRYKSKPKPELAIQGFDTETVKGKVYLIARDDGKLCYPQSAEELLKWLHKESNTGKVNYFWNLGYDAMAILKWLPSELYHKLYYENVVIYKGFKIVYYNRKMLYIRKGRTTVYFYDLWQFYKSSLNKAASSYFEEKKIDIDIKQIERARWRKANKEAIEKYCSHDAVLCQRLGDKLHDLLWAAGLSVNKPISQAYIALQYLTQQTFIPRCFFKEYDEYAFNAYHGGRFEVLQRGYFPQVYCYDINSAYPHKIANLYDLSLGKWVKSESIPKGAVYGYLKVNATCSDSWLSPLAVMHRNVLKFPRLENKQLFLTLGEVRYILKHKLCDISIVDGWFWIPVIRHKLFSCIKEMYDKRQVLKSENNKLELVYKIMLNSIYGKFMQTQPYLAPTKWNDPRGIYLKQVKGKLVNYKFKYKTGNYFNPVYAAEITAQTRLQLYDKARRLGRHVIALFTDSIFTTKKLKDCSLKLGEFNLKEAGEMLMVGCGIYSVRNKAGVTTRFRGFNLPKELDIWSEMSRTKDSTNMTFMLKQIISLGKIMEREKVYNYSRLNIFEDLPKQLNVNFDHKRLWSDSFKSCSDVLTRQVSSQTLPL